METTTRPMTDREALLIAFGGLKAMEHVNLGVSKVIEVIAPNVIAALASEKGEK